VRKKFIKFSDAEKIMLEDGRKNGATKAFQDRCHCLLLNAAGYQVKELARIFGVSEICLYSWLKRWETGGIVGLKDKAGRGRKPILKAADLPQIKAVVQANAQQLKVARQKLKEELGREFSAKTLKRFLKNLTADIKDGANV
jgi:transposase